MKPKKFSEINFQPFVVFAELLEKTLPDCCVRRPCMKSLENDVDINKNYISDLDGVSIFENSDLAPYDHFKYMVTNDRFSYLQKNDSYVVMSFDCDFGLDKEYENHDKISIEFGYINNNIDEIEKVDILGWSYPISVLDNVKFIEKLQGFLKTKFINDEELEKLVNIEFEEWLKNNP